jgi:dihydrolipoamide dehydrogenase
MREVNMEEFDLAIIGGGSAGYVAAIRAADLGKKVLLIEHRELGGTCLNRGCIPTKALLRSAEVYLEAKESRIFGIDATDASFDPEGILKWKDSVVQKMVTGVKFLLNSRKVVVVKGKGRLLDGNTVEVETEVAKQSYRVKDIIIATGSEPALIPAFKIDRVNVLTSDDALSLASYPKEILIVGAGAIGIEFANFFSAFGTKVTIVEMMPQVIPTLKDRKITALVQRMLNKKGITLKLGEKIENIEIKANNSVSLTLGNGETLESEKVLVSIGRKINSDGIGLEEIGIKTEKGKIIVDEYLRTNIPHIYAIGDVTGGLLLAHKAMKEGEVAAEVIADKEIKMDYRVIPWAIFSTPEIASVGLTEEESKEQGIEVITGEFLFAANGKAVAMNQTEGEIKIVGRKDTHELIGAQIIGPDASLIIAELALALEKKLSIEDIARTIHTHPTLAEATMEAAKAAIGEVVHMARR